jgi:hypothetical protein
MSQANDFTRRWIADFFAARLGARAGEAEAPRPMRRRVELTPTPHAEPYPSLPSELGDPGGAEASEID